ncbi:hypothetical protein CFN78_14955 [Amycolatopsis antarctica]|uniref:DUF2795 domain-containing protein n=1 Tax=Amycolatopsis antarctica TaxID=1854586 RepID=A0A263D277_9PSEU|nr:DUF2795 domain-containing protein [Amycolatopsis antarctica]OZM72309.1 hypothetical protein CFN78_14955 [Amycolatopsis antarctica]
MNERGQDAVEHALSGMEYPCRREALMRHAASNGADDDTLGHLGSLTGDHFDDLAAVRESLRHKDGRAGD